MKEGPAGDSGANQNARQDRDGFDSAPERARKQSKSVFWERATPEQIAHVHELFRAKREWWTRRWLNEDPTCPERYVLRRIAYGLGYDPSDPVDGYEVLYTGGHARLEPFL
jgi:hypothetical protein